MKLSQTSLTAIEDTIKRATDRYACGCESTIVTDLHLQAMQNSGELSVYDDEDVAISRKYIKNDEEEIPLIRLSEMYYICCESAPLDQAATYINEVRQKRGISRSNDLSFTTEQSRIDALNLEYRKDFYAEGQYFHFLKRFAEPTFLNCPLDNMTEAQYIFPLPDAEREYGWTDSMTDGEGTADNESSTTGE